MTDIVELGAERFARCTENSQVSPRDALLGALAALDSGEIHPSHLVIVHYSEADTGYFQAGPANMVVVSGMLHRGLQLMWRDAE